MDEDDIDGCDEVGSESGEILEDWKVDTFVLFADIDPEDDEAIAKRLAEWEELFGDQQ